MNNEWVVDSHGNKCSVIYFDSVERAQAALDSLTHCSNCTNCSYCSHCLNCADCSNCSRCTNCADCSRCRKCSYCANCSRCKNRSNCANFAYYEGCDGKKTSNCPIPSINNIDRVIYDAITLTGHLDMSDWHMCETTHCRAGWIVHLAGPAGYALEKSHSTELAAMLIHRESGSPISPARFYDSGKDAMADIKKRAGITEDL